MAMGDFSKHGVWFRKLLYLLVFSCFAHTVIHMLLTTLFNDNTKVVFLSQESAVNSQSKKKMTFDTTPLRISQESNHQNFLYKQQGNSGGLSHKGCVTDYT